MAKTTADLVFSTRVYLDESQPQDFTVQEVLAACNYAYHYLVSKVMEVYEEFYLTTTPRHYSTVANVQQITIDNDLLKLERVEINYQPSDPNSTPQRALALKMDELPLALDNNLVGGSNLYNAGYYFIGAQSSQQIGFVPVPAVTATDCVAVWGIYAPGDLVNTTDPVLIPYPDNFALIIAKMAAGQLLKKGQQAVQAADDLLAEAAADTLNMVTFIKERQSDGPMMIEDVVFDDVAVGDYVI